MNDFERKNSELDLIFFMKEYGLVEGPINKGERCESFSSDESADAETVLRPRQIDQRVFILDKMKRESFRIFREPLIWVFSVQSIPVMPEGN